MADMMTQEMKDNLEAVERCCRISAMMLEMADQGNKALLTNNQGQAALRDIMTDEDAIKILKIARIHSESYGRDVAGTGCATAVSNTAWNILRSFGYEHEDIMRLYKRATEEEQT